MRRMVTGLMLAVVAGALAQGGMVLVEHDTPASTIACAGAQSGGKCDLVWVNYSVETLQADKAKANCPRTSGECYQSYEDPRSTSAGWGSPASTPLVPKTTLGPLTVAVSTTSVSQTNDVRAWGGIRADDGGSGAVAAGGGRNASNDPYACLTAYGNDETDGSVISNGLADATISDDRSDHDTDAQVCGELLRGVL